MVALTFFRRSLSLERLVTPFPVRSLGAVGAFFTGAGFLTAGFSVVGGVLEVAKIFFLWILSLRGGSAGFFCAETFLVEVFLRAVVVSLFAAFFMAAADLFFWGALLADTTLAGVFLAGVVTFAFATFLMGATLPFLLPLREADLVLATAPAPLAGTIL